MNEFIHPGDFFTIRKGTGGGSHGEEPTYVGLFLKACFALSEVPVLQRRGLATNHDADVRAGACGGAGVVVGGKVPIVITSRSDEAQARLASIAAAVVALD